MMKVSLILYGGAILVKNNYPQLDRASGSLRGRLGREDAQIKGFNKLPTAHCLPSQVEVVI